MIFKDKFYALLSQDAYRDESQISSEYSGYKIEKYDFNQYKECMTKCIKPKEKILLSDIKKIEKEITQIKEGGYAISSQLENEYLSCTFYKKQLEILNKGDEGYFGRAYILTNKRDYNDKRIIFAHRGTDELSDYDDNLEILLSRWKKTINITPGQIEIANAFVNFVMTETGILGPVFIEHTGHSLGAFIGEFLTVKKNHSLAITFESPGSYDFFNYNEREIAKIRITTHTSNSNFVNRGWFSGKISRQAGTVKIFANTWRGHGLDNIIEYGFNEDGTAKTSEGQVMGCTIL